MTSIRQRPAPTDHVSDGSRIKSADDGTDSLPLLQLASTEARTTSPPSPELQYERIIIPLSEDNKEPRSIRVREGPVEPWCSPTAAKPEDESSSTLLSVEPKKPVSGHVTVDGGRADMEGQIYRRHAALMFIFAFGAAALAVVHHIYYTTLDGTPVASTNHQQWAIRFGTALAFLFQSCLQAATVTALGQYVWKTLRTKSLTIGGIDGILAITSNPTTFCRLELYREAKVVLLLALLTWLLPLAAVIPPSTLSVTLAPFNETIFNKPVPNLDWLDSTWRSYDQEIGDPSSLVMQIAAETSYKGEISTLASPTTNSSYNLRFVGPSLQCGPANSSQSNAFAFYTDQAMHQRNIFTLAQVNNSYWGNYTTCDSTTVPCPVGTDDSSDFTSSIIDWWVYSAFTPGLFEGNPSLSSKFNMWDLNLGQPATSDLLNSGTQQLWVQLFDRTFVCQLVSSAFDIRVEHVQGSQIVVPNSIEKVENFVNSSESDTSQSEDGAYTAIFAALADILNGNVSFSGNGEILDHTSSILETGLLACPELNITAPEVAATNAGGPNIPTSFTDFSIYYPSEPWQCRNRSLERAIEDLANNVTISMLSSSYLTQNSSILVKASENIVIYTYGSQNLIFSYSIALILTSIAIFCGVNALKTHGVTHSQSFSAMVATTRNPTLDDLFKNHDLGTLPLPQPLLKTKLKFGVLTATQHLKQPESYPVYDGPGPGWARV